MDEWNLFVENGRRTPEIQRMLENMRGKHVLHYECRKIDDISIDVEILVAIDCMIIESPDIIIPKREGAVVQLRETTTMPEGIVEQVIDYYYDGIRWQVQKVKESVYGNIYKGR